MLHWILVFIKYKILLTYILLKLKKKLKKNIRRYVNM